MKLKKEIISMINEDKETCLRLNEKISNIHQEIEERIKQQKKGSNEPNGDIIHSESIRILAKGNCFIDRIDLIYGKRKTLSNEEKMFSYGKFILKIYIEPANNDGYIFLFFQQGQIRFSESTLSGYLDNFYFCMRNIEDFRKLRGFFIEIKKELVSKNFIEDFSIDF